MTMQLDLRMTAIELTQLSSYEQVIERGLKTFQEVGAALLAIRDGRLYREQYGTFEEYCQQRWHMSRSYAHRTIDAAQVIVNLLPIGNIMPTVESQARPLTRLEPDAQRKAWQEAVETAPNGKVTGAHVAKIAERYMTTNTIYTEAGDASRLNAIRKVIQSQPEAESSIIDDLSEGRRGWYHETILCYCDDTTPEEWQRIARQYVSESKVQFVLREPKPYPTGDILPEDHASEYSPIRLAVTPVTQRPLTTPEGEAVVARYLERHGKPEDLTYQRAMVESLIITDVQPLIREDRTITYDTFRNAKRRIADELDRKIHAANQAKKAAEPVDRSHRTIRLTYAQVRALYAFMMMKGLGPNQGDERVGSAMNPSPDDFEAAFEAVRRAALYAPDLES